MRNAVRGLLIAGAVLGLVGSSAAQDWCTSQLELANQYLGPLVKPIGEPTTSAQAVGMMVVTLKLGESPCFMSGGEIEVGSGIAPDPNTIFELASMTKVFTTAILAMHWWDGLDVTASVNDYLPPGFALTPHEQPVTFQQLATFTGGFWWSDPPNYNKNEVYGQEKFVDAVNHLHPAGGPSEVKGNPAGPIPGLPGKTYLPTYNFYSNSSVGFLGQILMNMDGKGVHELGFSNWMSEKITGPLGMSHTTVEPAGTWATGYKFVPGPKKNDDGTYKPEKEPFPFVPWAAAGGLRSNANDMAIFLRASICAHHMDDPNCADLPRDILRALGTAQLPESYLPSGSLADPTIYINGGPRLEQGFAWNVLTPPTPNPKGITTIIEKGGAHPGFGSWIGFDPSTSYGLVILVNTKNIGIPAPGRSIILNTP